MNMSTDLTRLTLYAILSSIEEDLAQAIINFVVPNRSDEQLFKGELLKKLVQRKEKDEKENGDSDQLLYYTDLGDKTQILLREINYIPEGWRKKTKEVFKKIDSLVSIRNRVMHQRPLLMNDHPAVVMVSNDVANQTVPIWPKTKEVWEKLKTDSSFLLRLRIEIPDYFNDDILNNLPQAEFDETGFIGRNDQIEKLHKALLGPYPVITITGEGGLGKTALALKVCYDLLDEETNPFDAIIWTTAKASKLTNTEIASIDGAISTSIGLFEHASAVIGEETSKKPLDKLISHLEAFPILLVIDNLESVLDENIRELVERVPRGSKILFTSRFSIGSFDFPIPLEPLELKEATSLLRIAAKFWSVKFLATSSQPQLEEYCEKLQKNPLAIKWFVQAVAAGRTPEMVLGDRKLVLKYCLSSVLDKLSQPSKIVLETLVLLSKPQTEATLVYYSKLQVEVVGRSLNELLASNLVKIEKESGNLGGYAYQPSAMAFFYMKNYADFGLIDARDIITKHKTLVAEKERLRGIGAVDQYDLNNFVLSSESDYIAVGYLKKSIEHLKKGEIQSAKKLIDDAVGIDPNYFECKRVQAYYYMEDDQLFQARDAFEAAISLKPDHPPLHLWYGDFLFQKLDDSEAALDQYAIGLELDKASIPLLLSTARAKFVLRDFEGALKDIKRAQFQTNDETPTRLLRRISNMICQYYSRKLAHIIDAGQLEHAVEFLFEFKKSYSDLDKTTVDRLTKSKVQNMLRSINFLKEKFSGIDSEIGRISEYLDWFNDEFVICSGIGQGLAAHTAKAGLDGTGKLKSANGKFGFITSKYGDLYFALGDWNSDLSLEQELVGIDLRFSLGHNAQGTCAKSVTPLEDELEADLEGEFRTDKSTYGFIRTRLGRTYFFPYSELVGSSMSPSDLVGSTVLFQAAKANGGGNYPSARNVRPKIEKSL